MNPEALRRYARHVMLPEVGHAGQAALLRARVLVVGAGGLGAPVLQYLVAAGVGHVTIMDPDRIEGSNLQRQVLFRDADIGLEKAEVAAAALRAQNPLVEIEAKAERFDARHRADGFDLVIDCTDNFTARYAINDVCLADGVPWIFGSVHRFQGQCAVFEAVGRPCYRCLFPAAPPPELAPNCAEAGVLGVLPGVVGALQANEALQRLIGLETALTGHLLTVDLLTLDIRRFALTAEPDCPSCVGHQPYTAPATGCVNALQVRPQSLEGWALVDVRSPKEHAAGNLGGLNLPLDILEDRLESLPPAERLLLYCQTGARSARGAALLRSRGVDAAFSLEGGYLAWQGRT